MRINKTMFMMLTSVLLLCNTLLFYGNLNAQVKGIFIDKRDGHAYKWIKAGNQVWMVENLKFATTGGSWIYNNDTANAKTYGRLYDWNTAVKACPKGWHLPSDLEWNTLVKDLGGEDVAGEKFQQMDTVKVTQDNKSGMVTQGFSALISGVRHNDGSFDGMGVWGGCWTATFMSDDVADNFLFVKGAKAMGKSSSTKNSGFSVRCVKK